MHILYFRKEDNERIHEAEKQRLLGNHNRSWHRSRHRQAQAPLRNHPGQKTDAQRRWVKLLANLEKGVYVKPYRLTLGEHPQQWLDGYVKTNCSPRTFDSYKSIVENHLNPKLGHTRLNQLQPQDVQQYYARVLTPRAFMMGRGRYHPRQCFTTTVFCLRH